MPNNKCIYIVTGLPRSGTPMMMKMFDAGGIKPISDGLRQADIDNPNGYYELEAVKDIKTDVSWLEDAPGKVVKMVSMLLFNLPSTYEYKIVFMRRKMAEIIASQNRMLTRLGEKAEKNDEEMGKLYELHLAEIIDWLSKKSNIKFVEINYNQIMIDPLRELNRLVPLCEDQLNIDEMAKVVNASLYRQRGADGKPAKHADIKTNESLKDDEQSQIEEQLQSLGYM